MNTLELRKLFKEVKNEIKDIVPFSPLISSEIKIVNTKSTLGRCKKTLLDTAFQIELSKYLLECDKKLIKEVLIHELIHTCKQCFNHGNIFKAYMYKVNNLLGYNVSVRNSNPEFRENILPKYKITCEKCGKTFYRNRLPKNRIGLKHGLCRGSVKIEQLY